MFLALFSLFESIAERIDARGAQRSLTEFEKELEYLSSIKWMPSWTRLNAPDRNRTLLAKVLKHKMEKAPATDGPDFKPDPTLNQYIKKEPEKFAWKTKTKKILKSSLSAASYPLTFEWNQPINAYTTADLQIRQGTKLLVRDSTTGTSLTLSNPPPGLDTSANAADVQILVNYTNHTGKYQQTALDMRP